MAAARPAVRTLPRRGRRAFRRSKVFGRAKAQAEIDPRHHRRLPQGHHADPADRLPVLLRAGTARDALGRAGRRRHRHAAGPRRTSACAPACSCWSSHPRRICRCGRSGRSTTRRRGAGRRRARSSSCFETEPAAARRQRPPAPDLRDRHRRVPRTSRYGTDGRAGARRPSPLAPGETLAVTGPSGRRQDHPARTCCSACAGHAQGASLVGGAEPGRLDPASWHRQIAWVPQRPHLFAGTIADNVRLARPDADDADAARRPRRRGRGAFRAAPDGLGRRGRRRGCPRASASGIALARAFLADRPLLLLDEPTANPRRRHRGRAHRDAVGTREPGRRPSSDGAPPALLALSRPGARMEYAPRPSAAAPEAAMTSVRPEFGGAAACHGPARRPRPSPSSGRGGRRPTLVRTGRPGPVAPAVCARLLATGRGARLPRAVRRWRCAAGALALLSAVAPGWPPPGCIGRASATASRALPDGRGHRDPEPALRHRGGPVFQLRAERLVLSATRLSSTRSRTGDSRRGLPAAVRQERPRTEPGCASGHARERPARRLVADASDALQDYYLRWLQPPVTACPRGAYLPRRSRALAASPAVEAPP